VADPEWGLEVDFIAVGSGAGALSAAITAHDAGLRPLILEKSSMLGGVTALSLGEVWFPNNHVGREVLGVEDDREAAKSYLDFLSAGMADPELQAVFLDNAPDVCRSLQERAGVRWRPVTNMPDYYYGVAPGSAAHGRMLDVEPFRGDQLGKWQSLTRQSPHAPLGVTHDELWAWGGMASMRNWDFELLGERATNDMRTFGPGLAAYLVKAAVVDRGIETRVNARADRLVYEDGRVVGLEAVIDGTRTSIRAHRGVLLAVGGYDWNPKMARYFEQMPEWQTGVPPSVEGDHFVMAGEIGAAVAFISPVNNANIFGYQIPGEEFEGKPLWRFSFEFGLPHSIVVNRSGRRIGDESFYRDWQPKVRQLDGVTQSYPNERMYLIADSSFRERYPLGTTPPGERLPEGFAAQADTLDGLAKELEIDPVELAHTVERFNIDARDGHDSEFGRGSRPWSKRMFGDSSLGDQAVLAPVETAPFYGLELRLVSSGVNGAGLRFNRNAQVINVRGEPIDGLYVAGNSSAMLDVGAGYQSGIANARGLVWGHIAAQHASDS
jgi:3-oxosteroid 1-dehydrogenase